MDKRSNWMTFLQRDLKAFNEQVMKEGIERCGSGWY